MLITGSIVLLLALAAQIGLPGCASPGGEAERGPYAVGSARIFVHDPSRPFDAVGGVGSGIRTLITELWYPADRNALGAASRATLGDYGFGDRSVHRLMMRQTTFFHLTPDTVREGVTQAQIDAANDELFDRPRAATRTPRSPVPGEPSR